MSVRMTALYRSTFLSLGAAIALSSCGKVKELHDATLDMRDTTGGMSKTTEDMSKTTKRMEETTCKMYTSLRQGNSKVSRDADIEAIRKGKNITEKLELAAKYMQGFEYQVWTTSCADVVPRSRDRTSRDRTSHDDPALREGSL